MSPSTNTTGLGSAISRRRFLQGSAVLFAGLITIGVDARTSRAVTTPAQPSTTLTELLEAAPTPTIGEPAPVALLELAQKRNTTPEALATQQGEDIAETATLGLLNLDRTWPYATFFGNQPIDARREALRYALGQRDDLPDLGPLRSDPPSIQNPDLNKGTTARNAAWASTARGLLEFSGNLAASINDPLPQVDLPTAPDADGPEITTEEP